MTKVVISHPPTQDPQDGNRIIYKITNSINGKVYIGQTVQKNPKMRWYDHQAKARCGVNQPLFNAIRKYGVENFTWEVVDQADSLEALNKLEEQYVEQYDSMNSGYNVRKAGGNKLHNVTSIEKMKESQKKVHSRRRKEGRDGGWKRIDGGPMKGKTHKESTKILMSQSAYTREARKRGEL